MSRQHLSVVGAVVHGFALGVYFVKHAWEEHRAIHARVERAQAVGVVILHADAPKDVVPCAAAFFLGLVEALDAYLLQVQFRLFGADERGGHAGMYLFAFLGGEADGGTYVVGLQFEVFLHGMIVSPHFVEGERLVEDDDEVVAEILGHASAVACGVAYDFLLFGDDLDKGMVWVNGHAMGRFWEIGPQQTLFMPGCWLKEGENEILVLDLKGPAKASIKGLKKPILDVLREKAPETHRKDGEKLKLTGEKVTHEGAFTPGNGWQEVRFATPVKGRYFCLEALSPQANDNIAAIAEFDVLGADSKPVSREHWKIRYADSEETRSGNRTADKIFDLQESTFWMTVDNVPYPHQLVIDLSKVENVTGFRYLPRAEKGYPGMIKEYRVYVKPADFNY